MTELTQQILGGFALLVFLLTSVFAVAFVAWTEVKASPPRRLSTRLLYGFGVAVVAGSLIAVVVMVGVALGRSVL